MPPIYYVDLWHQRQMLMVWKYVLNFIADIPLHFVHMWQMAAEGLSDKMESNKEVCMKQSGGTELLHVEKIAFIDIHQCLLNFYGEQTVDVRLWVVPFSSGQQWDEKQATFQTAVHSSHTKKWVASWSAHWHKSAEHNQGGSVGILYNLCYVSPINAWTGTEIIPYVNLPGSVKSTWGWRWHISCDKTWCHHYALELKWQCWHVDFPWKRKFKAQVSADNIMGTIFYILEPKTQTNHQLWEHE